MSQYKHVLLALDLSENTPQMVLETKYIIEKFNAKLSIVHVFDLIPMAYQTDFSLPSENAEHEEAIKSEAQQKIYAVAKLLNVPKEACYLRTGAIKPAITKLAQEIAADLIIIGSNSHHGIEKLLSKLGNAILSIAPCSVLVIKLKDNSKNEK